MAWGLGHVSARELMEWQAYAGLYGPVDPQARADLRMAIMAALTAEIHRDPKQRKEPYKPEEFMPRWGTGAGAADEDEGQTPEQMLAMVKMLNAALGGTDERQG